MKEFPTAPPLPSELILIKDRRLVRLDEILSQIAPFKKLAIAFSGGLDSRFLSFAAASLGYRVKLFNIRGPHIAQAESEEARAWAQKQGLELQSFYIDPLKNEKVAFNSPDRCYFCKKELFSFLLEKAKELPLCDGTNHSDLSHYRPGLKALEELGIRSPLAEAGLSKQDNREVGALLGLDRCEQAALPCMLTRVPYNQRVNAQELKSIAEAETELTRLFEALGRGPMRFRLRKVSADSFELHIFREDYAKLTKSEIQKATRILAKHPGVNPTAWVSCEKLSGYFDRRANL